MRLRIPSNNITVWNVGSILEVRLTLLANISAQDINTQSGVWTASRLLK